MSQINRWMLAAIPAAICSIQVMAAPAWNSATAYSGGQTVTYAGQDYKAKWWTQNNVPGAEQWGPWELIGSGSATPTPTAKPTLVATTTPVATLAPTTAPTIAPTSAPTTPPTAGCAAAWNSSTAYQGGQQVIYNGITFEAKWWVQGTAPSTTDQWGPWKNLGACSGGGIQPTATPTTKPTATPVATIAPTASSKPTVTPVVTVAPTATPTATPVVTVAPTPTSTPVVTTAPTVTPVVAAYKPQITYIAAPAGYCSDAQFTAAEQALYSQAGADSSTIDRIRDALQVRADSVVNAVAVGAAGNPDNVKRVERVLSQAKFDYFFPVRNVKYTYENLLKGVAKFPAYCATYTDGRDSDLICKKLLATSFAHFAQETGANWPSLTPATARSGYPEQNNAVLATMDQGTAIPTFRQGLWFLREQGMVEGSGTGGYQDCFNGAGGSIFSIFYPCGKNTKGEYFSYFGRGSKQLSWNYNYGPFSKSLYGDVNVLLDNPGLVADSSLNFASAIWFAVYPQSPKPPMTWVVDGTWKPNQVDIANGMSPGFGATTYIINGGIECGKGSEVSQSLNRIAAYKEFTKELGVDITGEQLTCGSSKGFTNGSAAATKTYLDKGWNYNANNPGGVSWSCQLATYQTPFSLANPGDYKACVDYFFRGQVKFNGQVVVDNTK